MLLLYLKSIKIYGTSGVSILLAAIFIGGLFKFGTYPLLLKAEWSNIAFVSIILFLYLLALSFILFFMTERTDSKLAIIAATTTTSFIATSLLTPLEVVKST